MDKPENKVDGKPDETVMEIDMGVMETALLILLASTIAVEIRERLGDEPACDALNFATNRLMDERNAKRARLN